MKKPLKIVTIVLVGTLLASGVAWWIATGHAVENMTQRIAHLNQQASERGGPLKLEYERLARGGFPAVGVRVINPVLHYTAPGEAGATARWDYRGEVTITTDYLWHEFRVTSQGHSEIVVQAGAEKVALTSAPSRARVAVKANSYAAFSSWNKLDLSQQDAVKQALQDVALLQVNTDAITVTDADGGAELFTQAPSFLELVNRSKGDLTDFDLSASIPGSEVTPAYGKWFARAARLLQLPDTGTVGALVGAGRQVVGIDMQVTLPHVFEKKPVSNGRINVRYAAFRNNFYELEMPTGIRFEEADGRRSVFISANWKWHLTPAGAAEMRRSISQAVPYVATSASSDELQQKIETALPELAALGPIVLIADIEAGVPMPDTVLNAKEGTLGEMVAINQFQFGHERWSIDAKGLAQRSKGSAPVVDLTLNCNHCDKLTGDIFTAARQWQEVLALTDPSHTPWNVGAERQAQIEGLLAEIGQKNPKTGDITFAVATPTAGDTRINNQPAMAVMSKIMAVFMPQMAQVPAAPSP